MVAFFGKVKQGINRGVATVGVKSRGVLNTTLLKRQIDTLSKQKRNAVEELGDTVYAFFLGGACDEETVRDRCMAVMSLDGRRQEKEEKLRQIRSKSNDVSGGPISNAPCMSGNGISEGTEFCGGETPHPASSDMPRISRSRPYPIAEDCAQKTRSGNWGWLVLSAVVLLTGSAGGYLLYAGYVARNPIAVEKQLNEKLNAMGLSATTAIAKDWTAAVTGSVRSHEEKDLAIAIVKSDKHVKKVSDAIVSQEDVRTLKNKLSGVVQNMLALKNAIITRYAVNRAITGAAGAPVIKKTYGMFLLETYASFSIRDDGTITTTIRNIAGEVNDKTLQLKPSPDLTVWRWISDIDEIYLPFQMGDEINEVIPEVIPPPPSPAPPRLVVNKPKRLRPPKPVMQASAKPAPRLSARPAARPVPPVSIDSAKVEGEINRSLRNAGINGVTAVVRDDMAAALKGTTVSIPEKQKAFEIAKGFKGVRDVKDIVFVIEQ